MPLGVPDLDASSAWLLEDQRQPARQSPEHEHYGQEEHEDQATRSGIQPLERAANQAEYESNQEDISSNSGRGLLIWAAR